MRKGFPYFEEIEVDPDIRNLLPANMPNCPKRFKSILYNRCPGPDEIVIWPTVIRFPFPSSGCAGERKVERKLVLLARKQEENFRSGNLIGSGDILFKSIVRYPDGFEKEYLLAEYYKKLNFLLMEDIFQFRKPDIRKFFQWVFKIIEKEKYGDQPSDLMLGADPEFNLLDPFNKRRTADEFFPRGEGYQLGCDGHSATGELRPLPKKDPLALKEEIAHLLNRVAQEIGPEIKVLTGGGGNIDPLGHHIHFNKVLSKNEMILLDTFVGYPHSKIKGSERSTYYRLCKDDNYTIGRLNSYDNRAVKLQPHGCEYRVAASSLIPELTAALHCTAWCVIKKWESLAEGEELDFSLDEEGIPTLESYLSLDISPDKKYTPHLREYWKWVKGIDGRQIDPYRDCLWRWVPGRKEVTDFSGIEIVWGDLYPQKRKKRYYRLENFHGFKKVLLERIPEEGKTIFIIFPLDEEKIEKLRPFLLSIKKEWKLDKIKGSNLSVSNLRIGISEKLEDSLSPRKLASLIKKLARELLCAESAAE